MYTVAKGHCFIAKGVKFAEGEEITEKAFSSKELFLRKVEAGHIVRGEAKAGDGEKETAAEKKARETAVKAAKKKKETADKAVEKAKKELTEARESLAQATEEQKADCEAKIAALEEILAEKGDALLQADTELAELEGAD